MAAQHKVALRIKLQLRFDAMKRIHACLLLCLLLCAGLKGQSPVFQVYLVGDAGDDDLTGETLDTLQSQLLKHPNSAVVFLGDNCYRHFPFLYRGFDSSRATRARVQSQLQLLDHYEGSVFFVPGNHDWWNEWNFSRGQRGLVMEEHFIDARLAANPHIANPSSVFLPAGGGPGPVAVSLDSGRVCLICMDTNWLIMAGSQHRAAKASGQGNILFQQQLAAFAHRLDSLMTEASKDHRQILCVAHHPLFSAGSMAATPAHPGLMRRMKMSYLGYPAERQMSHTIDSVLQKFPGTIYASGHVHALQYYHRHGVYYIISGSGSKTLKEKGPDQFTGNEALVIWKEQGFFEIRFTSPSPDILLFRDSGKVQCPVVVPCGSLKTKQ